jgi:glutaredoxin
LTLTIYSRPRCHLCEEMKAIVVRVQREHAFDFIEVDISGSPELERRYGQEIPVLELDGRKVAKYRLDELTLVRIEPPRTRSNLVEPPRTRSNPLEPI